MHRTVTVRAKHFDYWVTLDEEGLSADGAALELEDAKAEHILLAGLARCSISSLLYFARQRNVDVEATAYMYVTVTRHEQDERYGLTNIECRMDVQNANGLS